MCAALQELESQKHASTRTLSEAKMVAELHISELEDKLEKCQHSLKLEKLVHSLQSRNLADHLNS